MSNEQNETSHANSNWSTARVMVLALVSLGIGLPIGYVVRGSSATVATPPAPGMGEPAASSGQPGGAAAAAMPSEQQMKHMADKKAEPLLAQLQKNPNDAALLAEIGKTYLYARQFDSAAEYYERSVKSKPDPAVLNTLGGVYHYAGSADKALEAWNRALQIDPNYADALVNIGLVKWREQSDPKAAIAAWKKMLKGNPNHPQREKVEKMIAQAEKHANMGAN